MSGAIQDRSLGLSALPVVVTLVLSMFQWTTVASIGSFSVRLPYLGFALALLLAARPSIIATCLSFAKANAAWIVPYGLYLLLAWGALRGSNGAGIPIRQIFYVAGTIALGAHLARTKRMGMALGLGTLAGIALFLGITEIIAQGIGLSWFMALKAFLVGGDLNFVTYSFLRRVFATGSLQSAGEISKVVASEKNAVAVALLVSGLIGTSVAMGRGRKIAGLSILAIVSILLVLTNTRSVMIVALADLAIAGLIAYMRQTPGNARRLLALALSGLMFAIAAALLAGDGDSFTRKMSDRFSFEDDSSASRVQQYEFAMHRISEHPWLGSGYGEIGGHPIHNLFLGAWMHAGIVAVALVVIFYAVILARSFGLLWMSIKHPETWQLPIAVEWIVPLPLLPLFRVWVSGDAGHLFMGEWIALGIYFGLVFANEERRKHAALPA